MIPKDKFSKQVFILWFILAVTSLAFSGIYSILPFVLRTPYLASLLDLNKNFFKISLITHVNLGVLVWFLSNLAMMMQSVIKVKYTKLSFVAFIISMMGSGFIIAAPFIGKAEPILNNYVPILHNLTFILGISIFLSAILLQVILTLLSYREVRNDAIRFQIYIAAIIFMIATTCFIGASFEVRALKRFIDLHEYYEVLFWGFGHILQFDYIQLVIVSWFLMLGHSFYIKDQSFIKKVSYINLIFIVISPIAYLFLSLEESYNFFTEQMRYLGGVLISIVAILIGKNILTQRSNSGFSLLVYISSLLLIIGGGIIGYLIQGINVTIPAHYHGLITGISVSLMGLFYNLLPEMGFKKVNAKSAWVQIILYTLGQIIHITGLAISGGYGALRKSPDGILSAKAKMYMAVMGTGGSIALIGGILFIILIYKSLLIGKRNEQKTN